MPSFCHLLSITRTLSRRISRMQLILLLGASRRILPCSGFSSDRIRASPRKEFLFPQLCHTSVTENSHINTISGMSEEDPLLERDNSQDCLTGWPGKKDVDLKGRGSSGYAGKYWLSQLWHGDVIENPHVDMVSIIHRGYPFVNPKRKSALTLYLYECHGHMMGRPLVDMVCSLDEDRPGFQKKGQVVFPRQKRAFSPTCHSNVTDTAVSGLFDTEKESKVPLLTLCSSPFKSTKLEAIFSAHADEVQSDFLSTPFAKYVTNKQRLVHVIWEGHENQPALDTHGDGITCSIQSEGTGCFEECLNERASTVDDACAAIDVQEVTRPHALVGPGKNCAKGSLQNAHAAF